MTQTAETSKLWDTAAFQGVAIVLQFGQHILRFVLGVIVQYVLSAAIWPIDPEVVPPTLRMRLANRAGHREWLVQVESTQRAGRCLFLEGDWVSRTKFTKSQRLEISVPLCRQRRGCKPYLFQMVLITERTTPNALRFSSLYFTLTATDVLIQDDYQPIKTICR